MNQLFRFLTVGLANTGVGLLCIWGAMRFLAMDEVVANFIGYAFGLMLSFSLNRSWTFGHNGTVSRSFPRWLAVAGVAYLSNLAAVIVAHKLADVDPYLAQVLGIPAYTVISFLGARYYVFSNPSVIERGAR